MSSHPHSFAADIRQQLQSDGYDVHQGTADDGPDLDAKHWFSWSKAGMADAEVGEACETEWAAWSGALAHRLANSAIEVHLSDVAEPSRPVGPFFAARLPQRAFDVDRLAERFGISREAAADQVEKLKRQTVYMNDRYQVSVQLIHAPFGPDNGDLFWLSIKRRDRAPVHDWRELQQVKNLIVGAQHEGFEIYPAESRLLDTASQFHLWVFAEPGVRLPVGFREREVMDASAAAFVGAWQRPFAVGS